MHCDIDGGVEKERDLVTDTNVDTDMDRDTHDTQRKTETEHIPAANSSREERDQES